MAHASRIPDGPSAPPQTPPPKTEEKTPDRDGGPPAETVEEKTRRDRNAGDVADDLADFA